MTLGQYTSDCIQQHEDRNFQRCCPGQSQSLQKFKVFTNSSKFQLGAVITQNNRALAFFRMKQNKAKLK